MKFVLYISRRGGRLANLCAAAGDPRGRRRRDRRDRGAGRAPRWLARHPVAAFGTVEVRALNE